MISDDQLRREGRRAIFTGGKLSSVSAASSIDDNRKAVSTLPTALIDDLLDHCRNIGEVIPGIDTPINVGGGIDTG